jgi:tetratricopeptide (TPR) repeat protein
LPAAPEIFYGREDFVKAAISVLQATFSAPGDAKPARIAILGAGGIGKTATALTILQHPQTTTIFQQRRYFVSCDAAVNPDMLIKAILHALGLQPSPGSNMLAAVCNKLRMNHLSLLVLDNFETPWDPLVTRHNVEALLNSIAAVAGLSLIVTMRGLLRPSTTIQWTDAVKFSPLLPLDPKSARSAFLALNPVHLTPESQKDLDILLKELDYVPLAIKLVAQVGTGQSCQHMLKRWSEKRTSLLQTHGSASDRMSSVNISIANSLQLLAVQENPESIRLLSVISHLPDGVTLWEEKLSAMVKTLKSLDDAAAILLKVSLAYVDFEGRLKVLSPIRHYILKEHPADDLSIQDLECYYADLVSKYALVKPGPDFQAAKAQLWPENGNVQSVLVNGLNSHPSLMLAQIAYNMTCFTYWIQPSTDLLEVILPHLKSWKCQDRLASCHQLMGDIYVRCSKYAEATKYLDLALKWFQKNGDPLEKIKCMQSLANVKRLQCQYPQAREELEEAHQKFMQIGQIAGAAHCLHSLGLMARIEGHYAESKRLLDQAQKQFAHLEDRLGIARCLLGLAITLRDENQYTPANEKLKKAIQYFTDCGTTSAVMECFYEQGKILHMQSQYEEAKAKLALSQEYFEKVGRMSAATMALYSMGDIFRLQGQYPEAEERLQEARRRFSDIGEPLNEAWSLYKLGKIMEDKRRYVEAKEVAEQALSLFTQYGQPSGQALCLRALGEILRKQHHYIEAFKTLESAYKQLVTIGCPGPAASCLLSLGKTLQEQEKFAEAKNKLWQAHQQFELLGEVSGVARCLLGLGKAAHAQHQVSEAIEKLEQALQHFITIKQISGEARCRLQLGKILQEEGRFTEAQEHMEKAEQLFLMMERHPEVELCDLVLAEIQQMQKQVDEDLE